MRWRTSSRGGGDLSGDRLPGEIPLLATVLDETGAGDGSSAARAVRAALGRMELERPVRSIGVLEAPGVDSRPVAAGLVAALESESARVVALDVGASPAVWHAATVVDPAGVAHAVAAARADYVVVRIPAAQVEAAGGEVDATAVVAGRDADAWVAALGGQADGLLGLVAIGDEPRSAGGPASHERAPEPDGQAPDVEVAPPPEQREASPAPSSLTGEEGLAALFAFAPPEGQVEQAPSTGVPVDRPRTTDVSIDSLLAFADGSPTPPGEPTPEEERHPGGEGAGGAAPHAAPDRLEAQGQTAPEGGSGEAPDRTHDAAELVARETLLEERIRNVERRERELIARAGELARHEAEIRRRGVELDERVEGADRRGGELTVRTGELDRRGTELDGREWELDRRRTELDGRESELDGRELELDQREAGLVLRRADLERSGSRLLEHVAEVERGGVRPAPSPAESVEDTSAVAAARPVLVEPSRWTIDQLEGLVDAAAQKDLELADAWRSYVMSLRPYADASGRLPDGFSSLIENVFGDEPDDELLVS